MPHDRPGTGPIPDREQLDRLRELFDRVLDQPEASRPTWLEANVPDAATRAALQSLLAAEAEHGPLDGSAEVHLERIDAGRIAHPEGLIGQTVGAFRLTALLGRGGMATVFLGERESAGFRQQAAVKLLRMGLYSAVEQRLFQRERQALSALSHPHIARLLDGGVTEAGVPYLVLEFVDGLTITRYAAAHRLGLSERLNLFVVVCRAVAAAHRQLIVHRDLKPSNILVDRDGAVKLLDFGIAKLLAEEGGDATRTGMAALTPEYAAPEQFAGEAITTATDVYALGVLLHELLLGERPIADDGEITRPSRHLARHAPTAGAPPMSRPALLAALRGDLDNILLKAMAGEPERRYQGAAELADDIDRHLAEQPVLAHPPSRWYRTRKFVRRHRGGVVITAAVSIAVLASLALATWQAHVARQEAQRANAFRDFLVSAFREAQPALPRDGPPAITTVVDEAARRAESDAQLPPRVRIELLIELGAVLRGQGALDRAIELLRGNHQRALDQFGTGSSMAIDAGLELLEALMKANQTAAGRALVDELLTQVSSASPVRQARALILSSILAMRERTHERALDEAGQALAIARTQADNELLGAALQQHSQMLFVGGRLAEAAQAAAEALTLRRRRHGDAHASVATAHANLSRIQRRIGDLDAAERSVRAALAIDDQVYPPEHPERAMHLNALVLILRDRRAFPPAVDIAREAERITRATYGDTDRFTVIALGNIGSLLIAAHDEQAAIAPLTEAVAIAEQHLSADSGEAINARKNLGLALAYGGDAAAGDRLLRQALADAESAATPDQDLRATICLERALLRLERDEPEATIEPLACLDDALSQLARPDRYWAGRGDLLHADVLLLRGRIADAHARLAAAETALEQTPGATPDLEALLPLLQARVAAAEGDAASAATFARLGRERHQALPYPPRQLQRAFTAVSAIESTTDE